MTYEEEIRLDILRKYRMAYYTKGHAEDPGKAARFLRWMEKNAKKTGKAALLAVAAGYAPKLLLLAAGGAASPVIATAVTAFTMCFSLGIIAAGTMAAAAFAVADASVARRSFRRLEEDIENGKLVEDYRKIHIPAEEERLQKLKDSFDGLLKKAAGKSFAAPPAADAAAPSQNISPPAEPRRAP